jgi:putative flippase GtrA
MLPDSLQGSVSLRREIDFGGIIGDRAALVIDHIIGHGRILLGEETVLFTLFGFTATMYMLNKVIATGLVMVWNYFTKRWLLKGNK